MILLILNFISYLVIAYNYRACAKAKYLQVLITDIILCLIGFTITEYIVRAIQSGAWSARVFYTIGGALGAQVGIYLTKVVFDKE